MLRPKASVPATPPPPTSTLPSVMFLPLAPPMIRAGGGGDIARGVGAGRRVDQDAAGDIAADRDRGAALQQVVRRQVAQEVRVGAARGVAVAGGRIGEIG